MYGTARATAYGYSIYEFAVYGSGVTPTTPTPTTTTTTTPTPTTTITPTPTTTTVPSTSFIKASGTVLRDNSGTGAIVNLRGTNLGGWLLQEDWMSPGSADQYTTYRTLTNRFGSATAVSLLGGYHDTWIQGSDLDNIKSLGMNVIRVPIYWELLMNTDGTMKPDSQAFRELDWVVSQSAQRGIYVILDLHGAPGGDCPWQSCGIINSDNLGHLWSNTTYQDWTVQIWQRLSAHFKGNAAVAGYDLLNEPLTTSWQVETADQAKPKFDFYNRLYQAIRPIDPDHLIIVEGFFGWDQALPPSTYGWSNVMYQIHSYDFTDEQNSNYAGTSSYIDGQIQGVAAHQQQWNVPVYAGEFWFGQYPDLTGKYVAGMNNLNVSWTGWTYKVTGSDNWGLFTDNANPKPDFNNDSAATIAAKWSMFATSNFKPNTVMQNLFASYTHPVPTQWSSIKAMANSNFVSADNAGASPLIANRTTAQGWEKFQIVNNSDGTISFLSMANGKYVTADISTTGGNKLIAQATTIQQWEKFKQVNLGNGTVAFQAMANNQFVTCDLSTGSPVLYATRAAVGGSWEAFVISPA
jgi:aryl-phospho-beta-D-glucosidase BglC (GH1 family)